MSSNKANSGVVEVKPTDSELKFMIMVLANQQTKPIIDWKTLHIALGYKSASVAATRWGQIGRKLGFKSESGDSPRKAVTKVSGNMSSPPGSPSPSKKRKLGGGVSKNQNSRVVLAKPEEAIKLESTKYGSEGEEA